MSTKPACPVCNKDGSNIVPKGGYFGGEMLQYYDCTYCNLHAAIHYKGPPRIAIWYQLHNMDLADKWLKELDKWRKSAVSREDLESAPWSKYTVDTSVVISPPPKELCVQILFGGEWVNLKSA